MKYYNILSHFFGIFASYSFPFFIQKWINKVYVRIFGIDLSEHDPIEHYSSLNALFTRSLVKDRSFDKDATILISPCDAKIIALGQVQNATALQIKGKTYMVSKLVGEEVSDSVFFCNFYLSPKDYHRFHAPTDLKILSISYFDGYLFSVRESVLRQKDNVFVCNERVVIKAMDSYGKIFFLVAIGAMNVGKIVIYVEPRIQTNIKKTFVTYSYDDPIYVKKGQEIGHFKMGSSIVLLGSSWNILAQEGNNVRFGDCIGVMEENQHVQARSD